MNVVRTQMPRWSILLNAEALLPYSLPQRGRPCRHSRSTAMGATHPNSAWSRSPLKHVTERALGSRASAAAAGRLATPAERFETIRAAWSREVRQDGPDPEPMRIGVDARRTDPATIRASWHADEEVHAARRGTPGPLRPIGRCAPPRRIPNPRREDVTDTLHQVSCSGRARVRPLLTDGGRA